MTAVGAVGGCPSADAGGVVTEAAGLLRGDSLVAASVAVTW